MLLWLFKEAREVMARISLRVSIDSEYKTERKYTSNTLNVFKKYIKEYLSYD